MPDASVAAPGGDAAGHVPAAVFGERGMDHQPEDKARMPIAAGLFGMATISPTDRSRGGKPIQVRDAGAVAFGIVARGGRALP